VEFKLYSTEAVCPSGNSICKNVEDCVVRSKTRCQRKHTLSHSAETQRGIVWADNKITKLSVSTKQLETYVVSTGK